MTTTQMYSLLSTRLPFWDKLSEDDKQLLASTSREEVFTKDQELISINDGCLGGIIVLDGVVSAYIEGEEGRKVTINRIHPDEVSFLGASCILHSLAFDVYMATESTSHCLTLSSGTLKKIFERNCEVENFVLSTIVDSFSDAMWSLQQILFMSMERRLAIFLYEESVRTNSDTIHLTQEQIAQMVGSAREVISRLLKSFGDDGIVSTSRGAITIQDRDTLRSRALG